jgi:5-methylcytosine-specific restriction endonuclease McrA
MTRPSSTARGLGQPHRKARAVVLERDGHVCRWCGAPATEADHWPIPRHLGGQSTPDNLVAACKPCNSRRGAIEGNAKRRRRHPFFGG